MPLRRPPRITSLPATAYAETDPLVIPDCVADLDVVDGQCFSRESVALCDSPASGVVCTDCALAELGESWSNLKARTNAGIPKAKFYRDLGVAQARYDPEFARAQRWAKRRTERG